MQKFTTKPSSMSILSGFQSYNCKNESIAAALFPGYPFLHVDTFDDDAVPRTPTLHASTTCCQIFHHSIIVKHFECGFFGHFLPQPLWWVQVKNLRYHSIVFEKKLAGWVWSSNEGNPFKFNINLVGHYRDQLNFKAANGKRKMTNEDYDKLEAAAELW